MTAKIQWQLQNVREATIRFDWFVPMRRFDWYPAVVKGYVEFKPAEELQGKARTRAFYGSYRFYVEGYNEYVTYPAAYAGLLNNCAVGAMYFYLRYVSGI